jgi:hypothetical protein
MGIHINGNRKLRILIKLLEFSFMIWYLALEPDTCVLSRYCTFLGKKFDKLTVLKYYFLMQPYL